MSPETRAFLDSVRDAEDPTPEDEARVLSAVRTALVAGAGAGLVFGAAKSSKLLGLAGLSGLKLGGAMMGLAAAVWLAGSFLPERGTSGASSGVGQPAGDRSELPPPSRPSAAVASPVPSAVVASPAPSAVVVGRELSPDSAERPVARPRPPASLREEIVLLGEVQGALERGDGAAALGLLDRHVTSDRQLAAERKAARIHALCALGRSGEARALAAEFARAYPASLQRAAIERSCAGTEPSGTR
jgi:hypothetical protein